LEHPSLIDATTFANSFSAFWRGITPSCDLFVRRVNLDGYERWEPPLKNIPPGGRKALTAEYAFSAFAISIEIFNGADPLPEEKVQSDAWNQTVSRLKPYAAEGLDIQTPLTQAEREEANLFYRRLYSFFAQRPKPIFPRPLFPGCGFLGESEGDVLVQDTLYEVKTVDRNFRSSDFRQLLTYAALNRAANSQDISFVAVFNPRRGTLFKIDLDDLAKEVSGMNSSQLLTEIVEELSSGAISR
jgi:hypothetical protein